MTQASGVRISEEVFRAYCGGLVHDLGKVWAQVPGRGVEPSKYGCETPERHQVRFADCPSCRERYRYAHGPIGANLLQATIPGHSFLAELAAHHHSRDAAEISDLLRWVVLGDHLSAGERDEQYDAGNTPPVPALLNPLAGGEVYTRPAPLGAGLFFGQLSSPDPASEARAAFGAVVDELRQALAEAGSRAGGSLAALAEHLTGAVYRGGIGVPSAFAKAVADIPLATHLHLAGAFAAALAADRSDARDASSAAVGIVAGDVSGIQEFIHDTGSRRAARALRARSFYVQLLSLVAARWVALQCGVPAGCAFSVVGGRFLVAVPASSVGAVESLQAELDRILWKAHGPTLSIGLAAVTASGDALSNFRAVYEELQQRLGVRKGQRYRSLARSGDLFAPQAVVAAGRACRTCGREAGDGREEDDDGVARRVCAMCASLEELGRELLDSSYLVLREAGRPSGAAGWLGVMRALGHDVELVQALGAGPVEGAIVALDDVALGAVPCARYVPTARHAPRSSSGLLDFEAIARAGRGRPAIATLKADVDDLGRFLGDYFSVRPSSPSRFLAISTALSLFFEAYLPQLAAREFPNLYLVFSGGDDAAVAGPLTDVLPFIVRLRDDFRRWTAGNGRLHFSAGVSASHPHRPVQSGMEEAERFLALAKGHRRPGGETKNAVTLLSVTLGWDELKRVLSWADELASLAGAESDTQGGRRLARGALQHLQQLEGARPGQYGPLHWKSFYQFSRVAKDYPQAGQLLSDLRRQALEPGGAGGRAVALAARLAELQTAPSATGAGKSSS